MNICIRVAAFAVIVALVGWPARAGDCDYGVYEHVRSSSVGAALPIASLPAQVVAPDGELTLYADYGDVAGESVALYLVNRTQDRIGFSSQDGDIYVKLEAAIDGGPWERAQTHMGSWCGNSYDVTPSLRPGQYFRFAGHYPSEGEPRRVRYRGYFNQVFVLKESTPDQFRWISKDLETMPVQLVSNAGLGKAPPKAIEAARRDDFAIPYGGFETVRDLAMRVTTGRSMNVSHSDAIQALGRFPTEESLTLVRRFLADTDASVRSPAMRALAKMGPQLESAEMLYQEVLHGDDVELLRLAVFALDERPITAEVKQFAEGLLSHDDLYVRCFALGVIAHGCRDDDEAKARINAYYDDPDPKIQSIFETILYPTCINYQIRGYKGQFRR